MRFTVTLEPGEDGHWIAECAMIPGCVSQGRSRDEAIENIREAIALCLEVRAEKGFLNSDISLPSLQMQF